MARAPFAAIPRGETSAWSGEPAGRGRRDARNARISTGSWPARPGRGSEKSTRRGSTRSVPWRRLRTRRRAAGPALALRARSVADAPDPEAAPRVLDPPLARFPQLPATQGSTAFHRVLRWRRSGSSRQPRSRQTRWTTPRWITLPGGWIWCCASTTASRAPAWPRHGLAEEIDLAEGVPAGTRLLARLPTVDDSLPAHERRFPSSTAQIFRSEARARPVRTGAAPSAAAFADPLLLTGFPLTVLGIARLTEAIETSGGRESFHAG